jgi:ribose transport system permease protein
VAIVVVFTIAAPSSFATGADVKSILDEATELAVMTAGLTVVLIVNEFDLSFANNIGLSGAVAILAMSDQHEGAVVAVIVALLTGTIIGLVNGIMVAYFRVNAFIGTLAISSIALGIDEGITGDASIYQGVTTGYESITTTHVLGLPITIFMGFGFTLLIYLFLKYHKLGRYMHAVGDSETAARLAGVDTRRVKLLAFTIVGLTSGFVGVIVTSRAASTFPQSGSGYLLTAYAAAFLGASVLPRRQFHPMAGLFGVIFLGTLSTGLTLIQAAAWTVDALSGIVLAIAVLIGRLRQS